MIEIQHVFKQRIMVTACTRHSDLNLSERSQIKLMLYCHYDFDTAVTNDMPTFSKYLFKQITMEITRGENKDLIRK